MKTRPQPSLFSRILSNLFRPKSQYNNRMASNGVKKEFAVIGLGKFGLSLALTLMESGHKVLGIDEDPRIVQQYADELTQTVALDSTDDEALRAVDISDFDTVVVAIGTNFESNLLTTVALKELGVRRVIAKALTDRQAGVLLRVGADQVIMPEEEAGKRLGLELSATSMLDYIPLEPGYGIAELPAPKILHNRTLGKSNLRSEFGINILLIRSNNKSIVSPPLDYVFQPSDLLVVFGSDDDINRFSGQ